MFLSLLMAASLVFTEHDAAFAFSCASNLVVNCTPRDSGSFAGFHASNWLLDNISMMGVDVRRDRFKSPRPDGKGALRDGTFNNLIVRFERDAKKPWIVFTSHFDTKPGCDCPGANDGASTSGLLMALAAALNDRGYEGCANIALLWLDGEESANGYGEHDGLWGSRRAASEFKRLGRELRAVFCLDMLGDRRLDIAIPANGTESLTKITLIAAQRVGVKVKRMPLHVRDDHVPFLAEGYAAIDLIDFEYGSVPGANDYWHTAHDTPDKLSVASLYAAGRLVAELINILAK